MSITAFSGPGYCLCVPQQANFPQLSGQEDKGVFLPAEEAVSKAQLPTIPEVASSLSLGLLNFSWAARSPNTGQPAFPDNTYKKLAPQVYTS